MYVVAGLQTRLTARSSRRSQSCSSTIAREKAGCRHTTDRLDCRRTWRCAS